MERVPRVSPCVTRICPALFPLILLLLVFSPCNQAQTVPSGPEAARLAEARSLLDKGLVSDAERLARAFLSEHRDSAEAHFFLGYILFKEIQTDAERNRSSLRDEYQQSSQPHTSSSLRDALAKASLAEFTEGAKYHAPGAFDLKIVALDYVLLGDYANADKWLTLSVQWDPEDEQAWYYLGRAKYNENRFEEAINAFEQCLKRNTKNVKAEENLGLAYAGLGRIEDAISAYKTAMAWQENALTKDAWPYINMGDLLLDQNRSDEAVSYLQQAIQISSENSKAHELLGKAYTRLNQLVLAQAELERAISLSPQVASLHCMLGPIYRKQSLPAKAEAEFERCSSLSNPPRRALGAPHP
jgi:tetratricopeptide (TPR) repeat protein